MVVCDIQTLTPKTFLEHILILCPPNFTIQTNWFKHFSRHAEYNLQLISVGVRPPLPLIGDISPKNSIFYCLSDFS